MTRRSAEDVCRPGSRDHGTRPVTETVTGDSRKSEAGSVRAPDKTGSLPRAATCSDVPRHPGNSQTSYSGIPETLRRRNLASRKQADVVLRHCGGRALCMYNVDMEVFTVLAEV